jgi:hypothetical protein
VLHVQEWAFPATQQAVQQFCGVWLACGCGHAATLASLVGNSTLGPRWIVGDGWPEESIKSATSGD